MSEMNNGELLKKIFEKIIVVETKLDTVLKTQSDHEKRIRFLERFSWIIFGAIIIIEFILRGIK